MPLNEARGFNLFDDLIMTLNDPTGSGFRAPYTSFDPSKFVVGSISAGGGLGFTGIQVDGLLAVDRISERGPDDDDADDCLKGH